MSEHHPNCAITRQGDIRAFCDCKWPEIRNEERDRILATIVHHSNGWHDMAKFSGNTTNTKKFLTCHAAIQTIFNEVSVNKHRNDKP